MTRRGISRHAFAAAAVIALASATAAAKNWGTWTTPVNLESLPGSSSALNTPSIDGCASFSQDGLTIFYNSFQGTNFDIFMATRSSVDEGFSDPVRLPAPVNSSSQDACPTLVGGHRLYFSSNREDPAFDIYVSKLGPDGWSEPENLGPNINTPGALDEAATFYEDGGETVMLFSSRANGGAGDGNIYQSVNGGPKTLVAGGVNSSASDNRPSVTRDGLTIHFDSTRSGLGGADIFYATRSSTSEPFGRAIHVPELSSTVNDTRPALSKDGSFMVFGSARAGTVPGDMWYATREKVTGNSDD
jgi:Tol biopolymer transport system component